MDARETNPVTEQIVRLGRKVAGARAERGLSQAEVAAIAGTTPATISEVENARTLVRLETVARVAAAVGLRLTVEQAA